MIEAETWDLSPYYDSFKSEEFLADFQRSKELIDILLNNDDQELPPLEKIKKYLYLHEEFSSITDKLHSYAELVGSCDTSNIDAIKYDNKLKAMYADLTPAQVNFQRYISNMQNFEELIDNPALEPFKFHLQELKDDAKYLLSDDVEILAAKLSNTGSSSWTKLFEQLWSKHKVPITLDGEEKNLPLAEVRSMAHDGDANVRKTAYEAELKSYPAMEDGVLAALNSIKGEVITMAEMRGYSSPLEMTLHNSRMEKATLDAMNDQVEEFLPSFQKYLSRKAELLNHDNGLPFYDLFAPLGTSSKKFSYKETQEYIIKQFKTFSDELASFAKKAFDNRWFDIRPREGKVGGGFCATTHAVKESRILTNSTDTFEDLITDSHELGHAFHNTRLFDEPMVNTNYPMPLAETASIFCETIVFNAAIKEASDAERLLYLDNSLSGSTYTVLDIYSRFLFENAVFDKRAEDFLDVKTVNTLMLDAQKKAYGSGLDHNALHQYAWASKPHYYDANYNYYNFPYTFGLLFSKGLYAQYEQDKSSFMPRFDKILNSSGKMSALDVGKIAGVDLNSPQFWNDSLRIIEKDIDSFIELTN